MSSFLKAKSYTLKAQRGFTLIEIMVAISVVAVLMSIATVSFIGMRERQALENGTEEVRTLLLRARARTLAAEKDTVYGIHLGASSLITFPGAIYSAGDPENEIHDLDALITIAAYALSGGGADIVFDKRTGATGDYGTITVSLTSDASKTRTISIAQTGVVE